MSASDIGAVLRNAARIEARLVAGALSQDDAKELLSDQSTTLFISTVEVEEGGKILAQNAINNCA